MSYLRLKSDTNFGQIFQAKQKLSEILLSDAEPIAKEIAKELAWHTIFDSKNPELVGNQIGLYLYSFSVVYK